MTETPFSLLSRENLKPFVVKFDNKQIFDELAKLVDNNKEILKEIKDKIAEYLDRIIMVNLKIAFGEEEKEFLNFWAKLTQLKSGEKQIDLIDKKVINSVAFWRLVELDLHKDLLEQLKKLLEE